MQYEGDVYRPPSEAGSLIIQVTIGCSHNTCTFCHMYTGKQFRIRKREEILADLEECSLEYGKYVRRVFFADGDALIVKTPAPQIRGRAEGAGSGRSGDGLSGCGVRR